MHRKRTSKTSVLILLFVLIFSLFTPPAASVKAAPAGFPGGIVYVRAGATGLNNGTSWGNAFTGLQAGIDAAASGDEVWVAAGTYKPSTGSDRTISFVMKQGVRIYGGFAATETARSQRKWRANATVLSGDIGAAGNATDNSYHVVNNSANSLTSTAVLDGFTITSGNANGMLPNNRGGGMVNISSGPVLTNLIFNANSATSDGGGLYSATSSPMIVNVTFSGNTSLNFGGGLYSSGSASITNVVFTGNSAHRGGGWYNDNSSVTVTNATFTRNDANDPGASYGQGGGLYNNQGNLTLRNSIIWGNTAENGSETVSVSVPITYYHSDNPSLFSNDGNINTDPLFMNAAGGDLRLQATSPARDGGNNAYLSLDPTDLDGDGNLAEQIPLDAGGRGRMIGAAVDMGAYERQPIFVDINAPGPTYDEGSWATAFTGLQYGIDAAAPGDEVWVADGIYQPTYGSDQFISFTLKEGVRVYGGFAGTETAMTERDWQSYATTLSGDLGTVGTPADNSQHVVNGGGGLTSATVLDGFTITWGNASFLEGGGGMYITSGSPTLSNLSFYNNYSTRSGGGLYLGWGNPTLSNVTFSFNQSGSQDGGGMAAMGGSPTLSNVTFEQNYTASNRGGGLYVAGTPALINVTFKDNMANEGGGIYMVGDMTLTNAVFCGNQSNHGGGAVYNYLGSPTFINATISGNSSGSGYSGGAIYNHNGQPMLRNSVVWGNPSEGNLSIYDDNINYRVRGSYNDIQNHHVAGIQNINADPMFRYAPTCDLRLEGVSPAKNAGYTGYLGADITDLDGDGDTAEQIPVDRNGKQRVVNASIDMGALERQPIYVNGAQPSGNWEGDSWSVALKNLYDAIDLAEAGDEIWVASGTYMPNASSGTAFAWFKLVNGVAIYGGFNGTETSASARNWNTNVTVLSCNLGLPDQYTDNCLHVINTQTAVLTAATVLDGFTITGGFGEVSGGGMYLGENSSPTLRNLIIADNDVTGFGGGMYAIGPQLSLTNVSFLRNHSGFGGAIYHGDGALSLNNVTMIDNNAGSQGGGIYNNGNLQATNVAISGNSAGYGGGIFLDSNGSATLTNVTIGGNTATWGGGIYNFQGDVLIRNSIFWGNTATNSPQIGNFELYSTVAVSNSDVQGGYAGTGNIDSDPLFVNLAADNLRLRPISPAINRGNNEVTLPSLPATDVTGSARIADTIVDMGAYEHAAPNHAPAVSGAFSLPTISEDAVSVPGTPVSSFLTGAGVSDAESNTVGIAVAGADSTDGAWQYSLNGVDWSSLQAVSDSSALLLARTAWLRFTPNPNWNGAATLTFRGWDGTDGGASGASGVNVTVNGLATPYSGQTATLSAPVTPVNDAPTLEHAIPDQGASEEYAFEFTFAADTFVDVDVSDSLMYSAEAIDGAGNPAAWPGWLSFNGVTRAFSGTPGAADIGVIHIRLTATDSASESATDEFDIIVSHTNHPPYRNTGVTVADQIVLSGLPFALVVPGNAFLDTDTGDTLAWSATLENVATLPAWLHFDPASRTFSGAPAFADTGLLTVRVIVRDSGGATATLTFKIQVKGILFLPIIGKQP